MTDCCFEEDAEQRAEKFITLALGASPGGAEPLQALANLRICQQRPEDALQALHQSYAIWKGLCCGDGGDGGGGVVFWRNGCLDLFYS